MENTSNYKYYRLEIKHLKDVQYIIKMALHKKVSLAYLENKYNSANLGLNPISSIAYDGQKPIAFYDAIPQLFSFMKKPVLLAHACDSFPLPEYQKKGLHYNLAKKSYEIM